MSEIGSDATEMTSPADWQREFILYPDVDVFPSDRTFPDYVRSVKGEETVHSYHGWEWGKVDDEQAVEDMLQASEDLRETLSKIPTALNCIIPLEDGTYLNATVVNQLIGRYVTSEEGEFVQLEAHNIASNAIGASHITAGAIDGKIITGAVVQTNATSDTDKSRVVMSGNGFYAYDPSGTVTFRIDANTGNVKSRGNFGVEDRCSEMWFGDANDFYITTRSGGSQLVAAGCGLTTQWWRNPNNSSQSVSAWQGKIATTKRNQTLNNKDYGYKGAASASGIYGLALAAPSRLSSKPPTLFIEEGGVSAYIQHDTFPATWNFAPQRFEARCPTPEGGYRMCVEGGEDACIDVWCNENGSRACRVQYYLNFFEMYNEYYRFHGSVPTRLETGIDTCEIVLRAGHQDSGEESWGQLYLNNHKADTWRTFGVKTRGSWKISTFGGPSIASFTVGRNAVFAESFQGGGWYMNTGKFYCYGGISKNFLMEVPGLTRLKGGMQLQHSATESPCNGVEYWNVLEADESGSAEWLLPEYVPVIASGRTPVAVIATASTGTAAASIDEVDTNKWVVRVSEAVPGARVSVLVKMARIMQAHVPGEDGLETRWTDDAYLTWTLPPYFDTKQAVITDSGMVISDDQTVDGSSYGPLPYDEAMSRDAGLVEAILEA